MRVAYAQNLLSTVNVVLSILRKDTVLTVPPATLVGERTHIRQNSPRTLDRARLQAPLQRLQDRGEMHIAMIALLCREFGLRFKEACLLNVQNAFLQARTDAKINITEGTKGGRGKGADRWVPVSPRTLHRKLSNEGTSFKKLHNEVRIDMAVEYLQQSDISIKEVAYLLGFSEGSNFHRFFKKWRRQSPKECRRVFVRPLVNSRQ